MSTINPKKVSAINPDDTTDTQSRNITDLLPAVNKTDLVDKFISSTVNHAFQPEKSENIAGFIGQKVPYYDPQTEYYLPEKTHDRSVYQLAPLAVTELNDTINHAIFYPDLLNLIRLQGGNDLDHNRLFQEKYYSWAPPIDLDKFVNYQNYLWLPDSLSTQLVNTILHSDSFEDGNSNDWLIVGTNAAATISGPNGLFSKFLGRFGENTDGHQVVYKNYALNASSDSATITFNFLKIDSWDTQDTHTSPAAYGPERLFVYINDEAVFEIIPDQVNTVGDPYYLKTGSFTLSGGGAGTYSITSPMSSQEELGFYNGFVDRIYRVEVNIAGITSNIKLGFGSITDESLDNESFGIDNIIISQEIETVIADNIGDQDYIVISRDSLDQNPWSVSNRWYHIDDLSSGNADIAKNFRAKRPIIEFNKNLELYNYGKTRLNSVDLLDSTTTNPSVINGSVNYVIDGTSLSNGMRILFTNPNIDENFGWDYPSFAGENGGAGRWDSSSGQTIAANTITLGNGGGHGIITGGTTFNTVFSAGQKIRLFGSSADGFYHIRAVSPTSITINEEFVSTGLQTGEVSIVIVPTIFKDRIFTVSGVGDSIQLIESGIGSDVSTLGIAAKGLGPYAGINLSANFKLSKSKASANSNSPALIFINTSSNIVEYDNAGVPAQNTITLTADKRNTANDTLWTVSKLDGTVIYGPLLASTIAANNADFTSTGENNLSIDSNGFETLINDQNTAGLIFKVETLDGISDSTTVYKMVDGDHTDFSPSNIISFITNSDHLIAADSNGNVTSFNGSNGEFKVYVGGLDVSEHFTLSTSTNINGLRVEYIDNQYQVSGYLDNFQDGDILLIDSGSNAGSEYYWSNSSSSWIKAQAKETRNQKPLFMLYDLSGVKLNDAGTYPFSTFSGNTIFSYSENTTSTQIIDPYLDIRLAYDQYGEILFNNDLELASYKYGADQATINGYYFYRDFYKNEFGNSWYESPSLSSQRLVSQFEVKIETSSFNLDYVPSDLLVYVDGILVSNYTVDGTTITFDEPIGKNSIVEFKFFTNDTLKRSAITSFELPINLSANPFNEEVSTISKSDYLQHFLSIIGNQNNFDGVASGSNNYRNLNVNYGVGTEILQHHNSLARVMGISSNANLNIVSAIKYSEREYIRFKNKLINKITAYLSDTTYTSNLDPKVWLYDAIKAINLAKNEQFPFTYNTISGSFIPATPSRLGLYPVYTPEKFVDLTLKEPIFVIQGHDGSIMPAYNDFRDDVILEFEQFIYDSIPDSYKSEDTKLYDIMESVSTLYRNAEYSQDDFNQLLTPIILQWSAKEGIEIEINDTYDETDPFTYNYSNQNLPGYWRGIINLYYGTDRPNTHPWEMFGFSEEPDWWQGRYGPRPYRFNNPVLWDDMRNGVIFDGPRKGIYSEYARTGLPAPSDGDGRLRDPISLGLASQALKNDQIKNWEIGDFSPGEAVFRKSSHWPFAVAIIGYLMHPAKFFTYGWDLDNIGLAYPDGENPQLIDRFTGKRPGIDSILQSENGYVGNGLQTWLVDYVMSNGQSTYEFTSTARNIDIRIGYKTGGFINKDTIKLLADNVQTSIPQENVNVFLYQNPSVREAVYSGITITKESNGWVVTGYDILNNYFYALAPDIYSKKTTKSIGQVNIKKFANFTDQVIRVPYGTTFTTIQQVHDFLLGYGEWLATQGWIFENFDAGTNTTDTWEKVANDYILWAQGRWASGASLSLSPSSTNMKFVTNHGFVENLNQLINGVYSLIDVTGSVIDQSDTFINRDGNEVIIQSTIPIFGVRLVVSEIEHVIILDNKTIFNDLIYSQLLNLYQPRLRLQATRTLDWVGRINAPGYFVKADTISPNLEKSVADVQKYFDIEKQVDIPLIQEVARRNIGYQSRSYLDQILISPTTQFQFYQGFIRNKGTISTLSTLLRSGISSGSDDVTFYEEWALKVGDFGNIMNGINAEFYVNPSELRTNIQLFDFSFARLTANMSDNDTVANVENTENLPDQGIIVIDDEKIRYSGKTLSTLTGLERGVLGTTASTHNQYTTFGLDDLAYDSVITINPTDSRWIMKPKILTNSIFNVRPAGGRRFNGEYLLPTDNRVAGYVLPSEMKARYHTIYDFTDNLPILLQDGSLEVNDQIWIDQMPSSDSSFPDQFQVYTIRLKDCDVVGVPFNYTSTLTSPLAINDTSINVSNTESWPDSGIITIGLEKIKYNSKTTTTLTDLERGYNNTLVGNLDQNGDPVNNGDYAAGTLFSIEYSGYGDQVTLELSNNTYSAGDTIIFENFFIDYINYSGVYEVIESYGNNIKIDLAIAESNAVNYEDISILDLIESRYHYESGLFNSNDYSMTVFTLASNLASTDQVIDLTSAKNLKAPGLIQINGEMINYQTINGNKLEGLGRGVNGTTISSHNSGSTVSRLKDVYAYFDAMNSTVAPTTEARWYVKANINNTGWSTIRNQNLKVDTEEFKNTVIYDNNDNFVIAHLQAFDPAKNLFPGQVAAEIDYKLDVDPADYTNGFWGVGQVGQVWWNTNNLVYENYEVSNSYYRSNNWGALSPFSSVDVYEWVESTVTPDQWATNSAASDYYKQTNGEPYYDSNGIAPYIVGEKVNKNNQTVTVYYFWVKDLSSNPPFQNRQYSVFQIANILRDPTSEGIVWFAPCGPASLLVANLNNIALNDETSIQINYNNQKNLNDAHTQWLLMREGDELSLPPTGFWNQMKASLSGYNILYQPVPDINVDPINRYGNLKRPRQSWFIDQNKAVKEFFKSVNRLFELDQIVDREGFNNLLADADAPAAYGTVLASTRPINPCEFSDPLNYNSNNTGTDSSFIVDTFIERNSLVENGLATIDDQILVRAGTDTGGFWRIYKVLNTTIPVSNDNFVETCAESFKYTDFWDYADFSTPDYDSNALVKFTYEKFEDIVLSLLAVGDLVRITDFYNDGTGIEAVYEYTADGFDLKFRENGTIQFDVDKFIDLTYGNPNKKITSSFYPNGVPGRQLAIESIIDILRNTIFTNMEVNLIFFSMINQVFSEQLNVDWAFKTTYIVGEGLNQVASQSPVFISNRSDSFIEYIQEAKPYHTKLRDFRINLMIGTDIAKTIVTDFDKPVWFDPELNDYRVLDPNDAGDMAIMTDPNSDQYWWSQYYNKGTHQVREIETTMYFDRVSCKASFGWDSAGWGEQVWDADIPEYLTAADRIVQSYQELPFDQADVLNNNVNTNLNLDDLIPGCSFRGTIVNNATFKDLVQNPIGGWSSAASGPWSDTPWSPLASGSNIIDVSDYNVVYKGNTSKYRFTRTLNGDGTTTTFSLGGSIGPNDDISVFINDLETENFTLSGSNITFPTALEIGETAKVSVFYDDSFNEASVEESSDIVLDGYLFRQPYIDSDHPEELVINAIGESLSIFVQADGIAADGKVMNKIYGGESNGPFAIGQTATVDDSILVFINGVLQPNDDSVYVISNDRMFVTIRNNIHLTIQDRIDIFSFGIGGEEIISQLHEVLLADTDTFTLDQLSSHPYPLVIVDGDYRNDYTISGDDIVMNTPIVAGSNVDIVVFKTATYTQMIQKNYTFSGLNTFDLGVTLPDDSEAFVSINGLVIANNGDFPDYDINGQTLTIFNKVKGASDLYNGAAFEINGTTVSGATINDLISAINNIANFISYVDKKQLVIANIIGDPITIGDSAGGASSMGINVGTRNSIMDSDDIVEVFMAPHDIAVYETPTYSSIVEYAIPHDIMVASQVTATLNGNAISYSIDTVKNTIILASDPGEGNWLEMKIKFINHVDITGTNGGTYNVGFVPFSPDQLMVFVNGIRLKHNDDYTTDGQMLNIPSSIDGDEIQVYYYSSRNANGNGSFIVHYDQESNRLSQDYQASNIFTLGNAITETDTTLVLNDLTDFNYGRLTLVKNLDVEEIFVREPLSLVKKNIASYTTLPNPVTTINQISVIQQVLSPDGITYVDGSYMTPLVDYNYNPSNRQLSFSSPVSNVRIVVRYMINNVVYDVIRNYDYTTSYTFAAGTKLYHHSGQHAKNRLYRVSIENTTSLAEPLKWRDREIVLTDAIDLPSQGSSQARMDKPGVIWIGGERIEFWRRDGNVLKQIVRGTGGTSAGYAESVGSTFRYQTEHFGLGEFTQTGYDYTLTSSLIDYMTVGDTVSLNNVKTKITAVGVGTFTVDQLLPIATELTITVFKPKPTIIPSGTAVYNACLPHEYEKGYKWVKSPFGLQFNTVDEMARFINFEYNK
ncbi:MAG: hypothetical protein M0R77_10650 [Gammaproteobacteria bacterium]|nr:hypothetical protein [Gammaproteobacteria bacterium]